MQNYRERLASVAAWGQAGRYGLLAHGKAFTASHIEELDNSEIERLYCVQKMQTEWQAEKPLIRLLHMEKSDLGLHCLLRPVYPNTLNY